MSAAAALLLAAVLTPVPPVSLEGLEAVVARQLGEVRGRLDAAAAGGDPAVFGDAGRHYHAYDMFSAAEACYRNAAALAPDDFRWPYLLALVQQETGRLDEAAASLERTLAGPDLFYPALMRMAALELARGRLRDAERWLAPARTHAADDPALLVLEGELALARKAPAEAAAALEEALRREPRASRLHYLLGMAYRALGRTQAARTQLAQAGPVGIRVRDPLLDGVRALRAGESIFTMEGHAAFRAGDFAAAAAAFTRAVEATGGATVAPLLNLAAAQAKLGQRAAALERLAQARHVEPGHSSVLFNLGVLLVEDGRPREAEPVLAELVRRSPEDSAARFEWAVALVGSSRLEEATTALRPLSFDPAQCLRLRAVLAAQPAAEAAPLLARARHCVGPAAAPR